MFQLSNMNITALYNEYNDKSGKQNSNVNELVAASLLHIIAHYFTQWSSNFVLTLSCHREHTSVFYDDVLASLFADWHEWPFQIVNVQKGDRQRIEGIRLYNMILCDSYESFLDADLSSYTDTNDYNEFYYIFVQNRDELLPADMQNIFEYCWHHNLINCVIQIQNDEGQVLIYTYFPYTVRHCGKVEVVLINEFKGTSLVREELFPKKLVNFYGCPLRAALWDAPPYLMLSTDSSGVHKVTGGFEGSLLLELSRKLNFTLDIKVPAGDSPWGAVLANGTLTGALRMLNERDADLSMGSFRQNSASSSVATPSTNYFQSAISLVSLEDAFFLSSVETLEHPFKRKTWLLLFVCIAVAEGLQVILKYLFRNSTHNTTSSGSLDTLLIILGMPAVYKPRKVGSRMLQFSWMFFGLVLRSIYQGYLFHMIRTHITRRAPDTLDELLEKRYSVVMNRQTGESVANFEMLQATNMLVLNSSSRIGALEYLEELPLNEAKHFVATLPTYNILYYIQTHRKLAVFRLLPYHVMLFKICIYMTKHSHLPEIFNELIVLFHASGLLQCWKSHQFDFNYFTRPQLRDDSLIDISDLYVIFLAMICSHVVATMIFVAEVLHKKYQGGRQI